VCERRTWWGHYEPVQPAIRHHEHGARPMRRSGVKKCESLDTMSPLHGPIRSERQTRNPNEQACFTIGMTLGVRARSGSRKRRPLLVRHITFM
jgi:hypothetical protein